MRAVIGLSLLLISGVLIYEAVKGNALNIMNTIRGGGSTTTTTPSNGASKSILQTPQTVQPPKGVTPGGMGVMS